GMAISGGGAHSGAFGKRRHRRNPVMSEINVTPMVDVMLVLLIIFMVSAPLLTVGVPIDLPQTQASSLDKADKEALAVAVNNDGKDGDKAKKLASLAEKIDTAKPVDDSRAKVTEKKVLDAAKAEPPPPAEPQPPAPTETKLEKKEPPKIDPIAETLKKEEAKK